MLPQDHVQELFHESFDQGVRSVAEKKIQNMASVNIIVLARMFCSCLLVPKSLILVKLDKKKCGVRVIRLCKEDINWKILTASAYRSGWRFGRMLHPLFHRMQAMEPMATFESGKVSKTDSTDPSRTSRERCISCTIYSGG